MSAGPEKRLRLYYSPNSCALAAHIALAEAGADYELVRVDFAREAQRSPEFLALNPLGRVPVLETSRGVLTEVPALLSYVASAHPDPRLAPEDPFEAAQMASFNAFVSSTLHVTFAHYSRPYRWADEQACRTALSRKAIVDYAAQFEMVEQERLRGPWMMGDQYTVADAYLYLMARWLERIQLDIAAFPRVQEHFRRMCDRNAVQRALAEEGLV